MGIIIGKFRKKKTTFEVLEKLEDQIKEIEGFRRDAELARRKFAGRFIIISFGIYLIVAFVICYYFLPPTTSERVKYIAPLLCVPVLLLFTKKILGWYYNKKLTKNQSKLKTLKEEKKKTLDKVMDTETYKVAKEILEKFAPEQIRKPGFGSVTGSELTPVKALQSPTNAGLRFRNTAQHSQLNRTAAFGNTALSTPGFKAPALPAFQSSISRSTSLQSTGNTGGLSAITPMSLPRPILPRHRSVLDKMVEYLIGDGPSNRYALICKSCDAHNGMAFKEEFEYLSFRCCYCHTLNPAKKQRPAAPRLEFELEQTLREIKNASDTSDSERNSGSDSSDESDSPDGKLKTLYSSEKQAIAAEIEELDGETEPPEKPPSSSGDEKTPSVTDQHTVEDTE